MKTTINVFPSKWKRNHRRHQIGLYTRAIERFDEQFNFASPMRFCLRLSSFFDALSVRSDVASREGYAPLCWRWRIDRRNMMMDEEDFSFSFEQVVGRILRPLLWRWNNFTLFLRNSFWGCPLGSMNCWISPWWLNGGKPLTIGWNNRIEVGEGWNLEQVPLEGLIEAV